MEQLNIGNGITAFGSKNMDDLTWFTLKWANSIAKTKKVLYLNWTDYAEKLIHFLEWADGKVELNLTINTSFNRFEVSTCLDIFQYIKSQPADIVFFDNISAFNFDMQDTDYVFEIKPILKYIQFLINELDIKVVFNLPIYDNYSTYRSYGKAEVPPTLNNFSRTIVNNCDQVYGFFRLYSLGFSEDEMGESTFDKIEIYNIKNPNNQTQVIKLDNRELKIYKPESGDSEIPEEKDLIELSNLKEMVDKHIKVWGRVMDCEQKMTKTNKPFAKFMLADDSGTFEIILFGKDYMLYEKYLEDGCELEIIMKIHRLTFNNAISYTIKSIKYA